jgi:hypothetical protein
MPFLGSTPAEQYQSLAKQTITGDGSTAYTLNRSVTNAYDMEVFINNIRQEPDTSYTASGNTITFTAAVTSGDSCYLIYQGQSVGSINPPAGSVGTSQIANNTITTAHLHTGLSVPDSNIAAVSTSKLTGTIAPNAGEIIKMHTFQINSNGSSTSTLLTATGINFTVPNVLSTSTLAIQISYQDLIETAGSQYARIWNQTTSSWLTSEWLMRNTSGNGSWRGVLATSTHQIAPSAAIATGSNNIILYARSSHGSSWYWNYNTGNSFINVWEIAG